MIKLFRDNRRIIIGTGNMRSYLMYAIGEILLKNNRIIEKVQTPVSKEQFVEMKVFFSKITEHSLPTIHMVL